MNDTDPTISMSTRRCRIPFAGRISFFKVISGWSRTMRRWRTTIAASSERLAHLVDHAGAASWSKYRSLHAGDLGAVAKLRVTLTGDTLGEKGHEVLIEPSRIRSRR